LLGADMRAPSASTRRVTRRRACGTISEAARAAKHRAASERTDEMSMSSAERIRKLVMLRELSRELVAMGAGELAAMIEDLRMEVARGRC